MKSSILRAIHWVIDLFGKAEKDLAKAAVFIMKDIKPLIQSPASDILATIMDGLTKSDLPKEILAELRKWIPIFLTAQGIISTLTPDSSQEQVKAELDKLVALFPNLTFAQRAQYFTTVAANIYILLHKLATGEELTFGEVVPIIQEAFEAYIQVKS